MKHQVISILVLAALLAGCTSNAPLATDATTPSTATGAPLATDSSLHADLLGDGSTFVSPLMDKWRTDFGKANKGVTISYTGGGSGKGRTDITNKLVDFAGSDAPMKDSEIAGATDILHIPVAAGGVAVAYNVPELAGTPLKFDGDLLANIFLGTVTRWDDPAIASLNPGVALPA
jgi:phosphate transport system substrate-binding protein